MGWSFRKSVGFGPFRVNFSKSGVSYSFGAKGARINTGPRGTYVNFGSNGIYYRKKISSQNHSEKVVTYDTPVEYQNFQHTITSAEIDQLTDVDSKSFIDELTKKSQMISYLNWFGIPSIFIFIFALYSFYQQPSRTVVDKTFFVQVNSTSGVKIRESPNKNSHVISTIQNFDKLDLVDSTNPDWYKVQFANSSGYISKRFSTIDSLLSNSRTYTRFDDNLGSFWLYFLLGITTCIFLCFYFHRKDKERLLVEIYYDLDDRIKDVYDKFIQYFSEITNSGKVWQYLHAQNTTDFKRNAGAGTLINRVGVRRISTDAKPERFFVTNVQIPNIQLRNTDLYFLPERLLIKRNNKYAAVFYKNLQMHSSLTRFIEDEILQQDAEVVDKTWRFLNKNGTPDRRFNNNRQLPICLYSQYTIESGTGVYEILTTSKKGAFDNFSNFIAAIGQLQKKMYLD